MKVIKRNIQPFLAMIALLSTLLVGCTAVSEDGFFPSNQGTLHLKIDPVSAVSAAAGATLSIYVDSNVAWTASLSEAWAKFAGSDHSEATQTLSGRGKQNFVLIFEANSTLESRSLTLTVTPSGNYSDILAHSVTITQGPPNFSVSPAEITGLSAYEPAKQTITIHANNDWTIDYCPDWVHLSQEEGKIEDGEDFKLEVTFDVNATGSERTGELRVKCGTQIATVLFTQLKGNFTLSKTSFSFSEEGGSQTVDVGAVGKWSSNISENNNWIEVNPSNGEDSTDGVVINVSPNVTSTSREGIITFTNGDSSIPVTIIQNPGLLVIDNLVYTVGREAQELEIPLSCPGSWTTKMTDDINWCQNLTPQGNGNGIIQLYIGENTGEERQCRVLVEFGEQSKQILVIQTSAVTPTVFVPTITEYGRNYVKLKASVETSLSITESGFICVAGDDFSDTSKWTIIACSVSAGIMETTISGLDSGTNYSVKGFVRTQNFEVFGPEISFTTVGQTPGESDHPLPDTP